MLGQIWSLQSSTLNWKLKNAAFEGCFPCKLHFLSPAKSLPDKATSQLPKLSDAALEFFNLPFQIRSQILQIVQC